MIRILANDTQKAALLKNGPDVSGITWAADLRELVAEPAAVYMDLLFQPSPERQQTLLQKLPVALVFIHSVTHSMRKLDLPFIRMNAWPGFLEHNLLECFAPDSVSNDDVEKVGNSLHCQWVRVPDEPGFISARMVAMIINEAYFALEEGVSSKPEIDIAMKTGTNYPFGPFEWAEKIGLRHIADLLIALSATDPRYLPAPLLVEQARNELQLNY